MSTAWFPCNQADSWQQLNYHTLLATHSPLSRHENPEKLEMILKICNSRKRIGTKGEKTMQTSQGSNNMETGLRYSSSVAIEWLRVTPFALKP